LYNKSFFPLPQHHEFMNNLHNKGIVATNAMACKVAGQEGGPGVTSHAPGSAKSVREWTFTLPNGLPLWELGVPMDSKFSECDCRGQNPSVQKVLYIIEKILKLRCLEWARMSHLDIWNTSYDQKKGQEWNWQFDSWPLKVGNRFDFLTCRGHATYRWKDLDEGYNFASDLIAIRGLKEKL
jgi:hypothetical protein